MWVSDQGLERSSMRRESGIETERETHITRHIGLQFTQDLVELKTGFAFMGAPTPSPPAHRALTTAMCVECVCNPPSHPPLSLSPSVSQSHCPSRVSRLLVQCKVVPLITTLNQDVCGCVSVRECVLVCVCVLEVGPPHPSLSSA